MFLSVESPCDIIFFLLCIQKCDLNDVEEAMFQVVERPLELICLLDVAKCVFGKVDKALIQVLEKP
jgi:hypothetical protein